MAPRVLGFLLAVSLLVPAAAAAQSRTLAAYSVLSSTESRLRTGAVVAEGDVGSNVGTVVVGAGVSLARNVVADILRLGARSSVLGDAYFQSLDKRGAVIFGTSFTPVVLPILAFPPPPAIGPLSNPPITIAAHGAALIAAGGYESITAGADASIVLQGGAYDVGELVVSGRGAQIRCAYLQVCTVRVASRLVLKADRVNATGGVPDLIGTLSFEFAGASTVRVGNAGAMIKAVVDAPHAIVKLQSSRGRRTTFAGRLLGSKVIVGSSATVRLPGPPPTPICGDGLVNGGTEQCDPPSDAQCPGQCSACECPPPPGVPVLHSVGPSVVHNATSFGLQAFGEGFLPGAELEVLDRNTSAVLVTLPTTLVSSNELTALLPAGLPVASGIQRELTAKVVNPGSLRSAVPDIGHCTTDTPTSPIVCTRDADCPSGAGPCVPGDQRFTLVNDAVFLNPNSAAVVPAPHGLCDDGTRCQGAAACAGIGTGACSPKLYVTPQQQDELWVFNTGTRQFVDQNSGAPGIQGVPVGDNPFHVEVLAAGGGTPRAWVVNRFDDSVSIVDPATDTEVARVTGAALGIPGRLRMETEIEFNRAGTRAYLSNENLDEVQVLDIAGVNRDAPQLVAIIDVGVNPRGMATDATDTRLYVANIQSANISVIDIAPGSPTENQVIETIRTTSDDAIVGGRMAAWSPYVIGGRAPRGVAISDSQSRLFVTSIGPQTGPRAGVSQIGGIIINPTVTVIDTTTNSVTAHVALNGLDRDRFTCTDPELMIVDDFNDRVYVTCQGSGTVDVLDLSSLAAGLPAELQVLPLPLPTDVAVPTLALTPTTGSFGVKTCAGFTTNPGATCTSDSDCGGCTALRDGVPTTCCARNNPVGLHNGPRGIAASGDLTKLFVVNQFTTSISTVDVSAPLAGSAVVSGTTSYPGAFGSDTSQRDRRLGQIEFFTDLKHTNVSCASCHIDDHQDGVFFEADVAGPRLRRVLSVRGTRDTPPLLQDQLLPDLVAFTDVVVHVERGGNVCVPCTELNGSFSCFPAPQGTCTLTSNSENQQNTLYAKAVTLFPNPNLNPDGSLSNAVPLPGGRSGDAVRGEQVFEQLACASCHPEPLFTLDQFRTFSLNGFSSVQSRRMREVGTPVLLPLRAGCQDANRPIGSDGSSGFGTPSLRGLWDTFPLLMSGAAGMQVVGPEPSFAPGCAAGSSGCCTQLQSPLNPTGMVVPGQYLDVRTKDALRAVLTPPLAVPGTGHGAALGLTPGDLDALIAYLRSL